MRGRKVWSIDIKRNIKNVGECCTLQLIKQIYGLNKKKMINTIQKVEFIIFFSERYLVKRPNWKEKKNKYIPMKRKLMGESFETVIKSILYSLSNNFKAKKIYKSNNPNHDADISKTVPARDRTHILSF